MSRSSSRIRGIAYALLPGLLFCSRAHALTVIGVGAPPCEYAKIQDAFAAAYEAATNSGEPIEVRVTRSPNSVWQDQSDGLTVPAGADVTVTGGYADCNQTQPDSAKTGIYGMSGFSTSALGPVLKFGVAAEGKLHLRLLDIRGGTAQDDSPLTVGGGIHLYAGGALDIADTLVTQNSADTGGGIGAEGQTPGAELLIGDNVVISDNQARSGGGVFVDGMRLTMRGNGSTLAMNHADSGYGGGLYLTNHACLGATAFIGAGLSGLGPIYGNTAKDGGGVALRANDSCHSKVALTLASNDAAHPTSSIQGNFASDEGGAIYSAQVVPAYVGQTESLPTILVEQAQIANNAAPAGAAFKLYSTKMSLFTSSVSGNSSENESATPLNGAIIDVYGSPSLLEIGQVAARNNNGGPILHAESNEGPPVQLDNLLVADNTIRGSVFLTSNNIPLDIRDSTIAHNQISNGYVLDLSSDKTIKGLIIDQPGVTSLHSSGGSTLVQYVVTSEQPSLGVGYPYVYEGSPRFVDPDHGDYRLTAGSPAVDAEPAEPQFLGDLDTNFRDVDLPVAVNTFGPRDIGAYERQALAPLVLNGDFDFPDLRLWSSFAGGWDGTSNATGGGNGSGSWHYSGSNLSDPRVTVARQCVFLPGPGDYLINGWGHTNGLTVQTRDYAVISWEFRSDGGEACNEGSPISSGDHSLGNSNNWFHPAQPTKVTVGEAAWGVRSSITLYLVGADAGVSAPRSINVWFDGITIDAVRPDNEIFGNGFD